jgi:dipeptidyl aminopeptidase/acylaminoacyl peptidase
MLVAGNAFRHRPFSEWTMNEKKAASLLVLPGVLAVLTALYCLSTCPAFQAAQKPSPLIQQDEDYAKARKEFKTKLVRKGPVPQGFRELKRPEGVSEVEYPSGELRLKAWVNQPAKDEESKRPAVLFLHGGFSFDESDWAMPKPYRDAGYVTLTPMLRGENGQKGTFTLFYDELDDVLAAADFLAKQPYVDPKQLFVAGHSVGGTMTLLAALATDRFKAASSFSGSPDQVAFTKGRPQLVPFDPSDPREFTLRSPIAFATKFKCPVRLYYGSQEGFFDASSRRTAELAKGKGLDVEAVRVPGNHNSHVPAAMKQSIEFFKKR